MSNTAMDVDTSAPATASSDPGAEGAVAQETSQPQQEQQIASVTSPNPAASELAAQSVTSPSSGSAGAKTYNVFVGDLKSEVTENDLVASFSACGPIASSHIIRDRQTGEQRGYGFVHFKTFAGQQSALKAPFSSMEIKGRPVRVRPADDKTVLWVSSLPNDLNENEAREALSALLPSNLAMAHFELKTGPPPLYQSRGFAFVSFETHEAADQARRIFAKGVLKGRQLNVSWAEPQSEVDEQTMGKVTTLYVSNIHLAVTDDQLRALFSQFGDVKNCVIVKSQQSRESRGFAFIEFHTRRPCEMAIKYLHRTDFCGQPLEIVLAKPPPPKSAQQPKPPSDRPRNHMMSPSGGRMGAFNRSGPMMNQRGNYAPNPMMGAGGYMGGGPGYVAGPNRGGYNMRPMGRPRTGTFFPTQAPNRWAASLAHMGAAPAPTNMYAQLGLGSQQQAGYPAPRAAQPYAQAPAAPAQQYAYPQAQQQAYGYPAAQQAPAAATPSGYYGGGYYPSAAAVPAAAAPAQQAQAAYSQYAAQQPAQYAQQAQYGAAAYGTQAGYAQPAQYAAQQYPAAAAPTAYPTQQAYGQQQGYAQQAGYPQQQQAYQQAGYGAQQGYNPQAQQRYGYH